MPYETILTDLSDGIFTITINRPEKLNASTRTMMRELIDAFDAADADDAVRAIIVTGAGRAFCAGADLSPAAARSTARRGATDRRCRTGRTASRNWRTTPRATAAAAHAAHLRMPQAGDRRDQRAGGRHRRHDAAADGHPHRLADARFGFVFPRRGIVPEAARAGSCRARRHLQALEWCYTGRVFAAEEALAGGLVSRVVAPDELLRRRAHRARDADNTAPVSVALTRQMMWRMLGADHPMEAHRSTAAPCSTRPRRRRERGRRLVPGEAPGALPRHVSPDFPSLPWPEQPEYR